LTGARTTKPQAATLGVEGELRRDKYLVHAFGTRETIAPASGSKTAEQARFRTIRRSNRPVGLDRTTPACQPRARLANDPDGANGNDDGRGSGRLRFDDV